MQDANGEGFLPVWAFEFHRLFAFLHRLLEFLRGRFEQRRRRCLDVEVFAVIIMQPRQSVGEPFDEGFLRLLVISGGIKFQEFGRSFGARTRLWRGWRRRFCFDRFFLYAGLFVGALFLCRLSGLWISGFPFLVLGLAQLISDSVCLSDQCFSLLIAERFLIRFFYRLDFRQHFFRRSFRFVVESESISDY